MTGQILTISKITTFGSGWKGGVPAQGVTCSDGKTYKFVGTSSSADDSKLINEIVE